MNTPSARTQASFSMYAGQAALPTDFDLGRLRALAERERARHIRELYVGATEPLRRRLGPVVWRVRNALRAALAERRTVRELRQLDMHMLNDIGLEPADIQRTSRTIAKARFGGHWRPIRPLAAGMAHYPGAVAANETLSAEESRAA